MKHKVQGRSEQNMIFEKPSKFIVEGFENQCEQPGCYTVGPKSQGV